MNYLHANEASGTVGHPGCVIPEISDAAYEVTGHFTVFVVKASSVITCKPLSLLYSVTSADNGEGAVKSTLVGLQSTTFMIRTPDKRNLPGPPIT